MQDYALPCNSPHLIVLLVLLGAIPHASFAQLTGNDGNPGDTTRITYRKAVRVALNQNTDIRRSQAQTKQSELEVSSEWLDYLPDMEVTSSVERRVGRGFSEVVGGVTTEKQDEFRLTSRSSITIFNGFENASSLQGAQKQAAADRTSLRRTRREVAFTLIDQFISLVESREIVRVRKEQVEAQRRRLQQIREFVEAGSRPKSDEFTAEADLADAEQRLLQARREREVSKNQIIQTLQLNPRRNYEFKVPELKEDTLEADQYDLSDLLSDAFQKRLDLRAAEAELEAARQEIRSEKAAYYPSISLRGNYGTDWSSQGLRRVDNESFGNQLNVNRGGGLSLRISIPVFDRFNRSVQVERAQVSMLDAKYQLQDQRQQVALQVRQAYFDHQNAVQQLETANKRFRAARRARTAAQERYELGAADIVELQNAIRDYVDATSQQIRARYNLLLQRKKIDYNVGRLSTREALFSE